MASFDVTEEWKLLRGFFNRCESAKNSITFTGKGLLEAQNSYNIYKDNDGIKFILDNVKDKVIGICEPVHLQYKEKLPIVHEYIFIYNDIKGCLAFYNNPREGNQVKVFVKSLHKNYQDKEFENQHVYLLTKEDFMKLNE